MNQKELIDELMIWLPKMSSGKIIERNFVNNTDEWTEVLDVYDLANFIKCGCDIRLKADEHPVGSLKAESNEKDSANEATDLLKDTINEALDIILRCGSIDGDHHKQWVLDQVVRILSPDYEEWVNNHNNGEEGADTYAWDKGIAP